MPPPVSPRSARWAASPWRLGILAVCAAGTVALLASGRGGPEPEIPETVLPPPADTVAVGVPDDRPVHREVLDASDAAEAPWGWVVLDGRAGRLAYLSAGGGLLRVAGRRGEGPGESRRPVAVAVLGGRVALAELDGRLHLFDARGGWIEDVVPEPSGCEGYRLQRIVAVSEGLAAMAVCLSGGGRSSARVDLVTLGGERRAVLDVTLRDFRSGVVDPLRQPMLGRIGDRLAFGITSERCLDLLGPGGEAERRVCYPETALEPLPDSLGASLASLTRELAGTGVEIRLPTHLPPFHDLLSAEGRWAFRATGAGGTDVIDRVVEGRLHRVTLSPGQRLFLGRRSALLAEERMEGTAFAVIDLP